MTLKLNITITIFISIVIIVAVGTTDFQHKIHLELDDQTHFNRESSATEKFQKEPNNYYTIQFIATPSRIMANNHVARLRNANVDAYVTSGGNCGKPCFRVRGGGIFESPQTLIGTGEILEILNKDHKIRA